MHIFCDIEMKELTMSKWLSWSKDDSFMKYFVWTLDVCGGCGGWTIESYRDLCIVHKVKCVSDCEWRLKKQINISLGCHHGKNW